MEEEMTEQALPAAPQPEAPETVTSYKGFDAKWKCRGFQYAVGETYRHEGEVAACNAGFHACEHPLNVFSYYPPAGSRFAIVEQSGDLSRHSDDTKIASRSITIKAEIDLPGLIRAAIEYTFKRANPVDPDSPASATGDWGAASATGRYGAASATGRYGVAVSAYNGRAMAGETFLSCLFGSEGFPDRADGNYTFLSCLFGSEVCRRCASALLNFLSCLFGSEVIKDVM